ncbi:hypothetical protein, partial [Roseibium sp. RKSG952]|uniref:hypothetical protein n=1 Tax=Roseibium sp. RKSG952 TaxID=2529384 RepID=UPI001AD8F0B6
MTQSIKRNYLTTKMHPSCTAIEENFSVVPEVSCDFFFYSTFEQNELELILDRGLLQHRTAFQVLDR